jgi:hypothetical protein
MKKITPYSIYIDVDRYSPPSDKKYYNDKLEFIPEITLMLDDGEGIFHIWKEADGYVSAVEIYPIHFLNYPSKESRRVQHIKSISESEYEKYNALNNSININ